ncbi:hypothetical protein RHMOL_Rhmol12G0131200 [Rhododendron molle]|nr:hypothetical protein RHMOL_Rhmol12G0131200 [Rhododendron molle]KAI8528189.1 hypothetical protein RHMOL_Rhmol12G0131200 [Rhododendron molle]
MSTILAVARKLYGMQMHNMVLELNASDERGIDVVRQQIHDFASTQSFSFGLFVVELAISDIRCPNFDGLNEIKGLKVDVSSVETDILYEPPLDSHEGCQSTVYSEVLHRAPHKDTWPSLKEDMKLSYLAQELISTDRVAPQSWCAMGNCYSLQKDHETALKNFQAQVTNSEAKGVFGDITSSKTACGSRCLKPNIVWRNCPDDYTNAISIWHPRGPDSFVSPGCIAVPSFEEPDSDLLYCVVESIAEETVFEDQKIWSAPDSYPWACHIYQVKSDALHFVALRLPRADESS